VIESPARTLFLSNKCAIISTPAHDHKSRATEALEGLTVALTAMKEPL
jgi:hypothetical protein